MSTGDWLVALGALLTAISAVVTIIIDICQGDDLTQLQEEILREKKKRWADGGKHGAEPDDAAAGTAAAKHRRLKRLIPLGILAVAAVCSIGAGLIVS